MSNVQQIVVIISMVSVAACSSTKRVLETAEAPTMREIYQKQFGDDPTAQALVDGQPVGEGNEDLHPKARAAVLALQTQFPFLPNPVLSMYIPAHLTAAGTPVPGYSTYFKLYAEDRVALPGEVGQATQADAR